MKRLFAALKIEPDAEFLASFRKLRGMLAHEQIKWVEDHNIHITLKFMGETDERRIPSIVAALEACAEKQAVFQVKLSGIGIFGSSYAPRVIWAGIEPFEPVARLMKEVHQELIPAGFEPDRQNLVPHLTLGRIKNLRDRIAFQRVLDLYRNLCSAPLRVSEIILFESILQREGPVYTALARLPLKKNTP